MISRTPPWGVLGIVGFGTAAVAIVDDDEGVRSSLASLVRSLGYEARSYPSAGAFLADPAPDPACLISDVHMPAMSGDALQAALLEAGRAVPMIFITASRVDATRDRVMDAGAAAYLIKPVHAPTLAQLLDGIIPSHKALKRS